MLSNDVILHNSNNTPSEQLHVDGLGAEVGLQNCFSVLHIEVSLGSEVGLQNCFSVLHIEVSLGSEVGL